MSFRYPCGHLDNLVTPCEICSLTEENKTLLQNWKEAEQQRRVAEENEIWARSQYAALKAQNHKIADMRIADCERAEAAELRAEVERMRELLDYARHTHEARYFKDESGKMRLTDSCGKCGLDLRHEIHAAHPADEKKP